MKPPRSTCLVAIALVAMVAGLSGCNAMLPTARTEVVSVWRSYNDAATCLIGGQPSVNEYEVRRNPLGPLQGWGDKVM